VPETRVIRRSKGRSKSKAWGWVKRNLLSCANHGYL